MSDKVCYWCGEKIKKKQITERIKGTIRIFDKEECKIEGKKNE